MFANIFVVMPLASIPCSQQLSAIAPTLVQLEIINHQNRKMVLTNATTSSAFYFDDSSAPNGYHGVALFTDVAWGGWSPSSPVQNNATTIDSGPRTAGIVAMGSTRHQVQLVATAAIIMLILPTHWCIAGGAILLISSSSERSWTRLPKATQNSGQMLAHAHLVLLIDAVKIAERAASALSSTSGKEGQEAMAKLSGSLSSHWQPATPLPPPAGCHGPYYMSISAHCFSTYTPRSPEADLAALMVGASLTVDVNTSDGQRP